MKKYSSVERLVGKKLDSFPRIRHMLKDAYQHINYYLHENVSIYKPFEWAKVIIDHENSEVFFGYYDKTPWSERMNMILYHELSKDNQLNIIAYDKEYNTKIVIGKTNAWNYQQGAMLQWIPKSHGELLIYNNVYNNELSSLIYNIKLKKVHKRIDFPIQSISPNGFEALALNYKRLYKLRAQYGYSAKSTNFKEDQEYENDGIWKINLENNSSQLLITLNRLIEIEPREEMTNSEHKVNHIIYSPDGENFVFMHRWLSNKGKFSRLYVSDNEGNNLRILMDTRMVSHYSWYDNKHIIAWARTETKGDQYYLINIETVSWKIIGEGVLNVYGDGHPSFSPDGSWMITDTYPDKSRQRHLLLYNLKAEKIIHLGRFYSPLKFNWDTRVDLHPRWSPDGKMISIDSCHEGKRYSYMIDLNSIVDL